MCQVFISKNEISHKISFVSCKSNNLNLEIHASSFFFWVICSQLFCHFGFFWWMVTVKDANEKVAFIIWLVLSCREEIEKQQAHERYMRLQEQGKTEQSRKDLGSNDTIRAFSLLKKENQKGGSNIAFCHIICYERIFNCHLPFLLHMFHEIIFLQWLGSFRSLV